MSKQVIRSFNDPIVSNLFRLSTDKQLRYAWKKAVVSSPTLINEIGRTHEFDDIVVDKKPKSSLPYKYKNIFVVTPKIFNKIAQLKNSKESMLATLSIPAPLSAEAFEAKKWLILDGISDLGDMGTILRSAHAFDWNAVWITHTCGDPFDPVCIRASQGALFSLPYRVGSITNAIKHARRYSNIFTVRVAEGQPAGTPMGLYVPEVSEATDLGFSDKMEHTCLLVQKLSAESVVPKDFKLLRMGGVNRPELMPLSATASSILLALSSRYVK